MLSFASDLHIFESSLLLSSLPIIITTLPPAWLSPPVKQYNNADTDRGSICQDFRKRSVIYQ